MIQPPQQTPAFDLDQIGQGVSDSFVKMEEEIQEIAAGINCEHAFMSLAASELFRISIDGGYQESEHGLISSLVELAAYYLYPFFGEQTVCDGSHYDRLFKLLSELNSMRGLHTAFSLDRSNPGLRKLQVRLQIYAETVRGSSYPLQIRARIENIQGTHERWFQSKAGIGPLRCLEVLECYEKHANANCQVNQDRFHQLTKEMFDLANRMVEDYDEGIESKRVALGQEMEAFFNDSMEAFAVRFEQVCEDVDGFNRDEWDALVALLGTTKESIVKCSHPRELRSRPVFFLSSDRFLLVDLASSFDAVFEAFDELSRSDEPFRNRKYNRGMSEWMEAEASSCLSRIFPSDCIYTNLNYEDPDNPGGEAELDGAVSWGPFLILCEVKGKQFRARSRLGDPSRLRDDLKKNIEEAFNQASRAIRFIESADEAVFVEKKTGRQLKVNKVTKRRIYPLSVTLHHFGGLATQLATLQKLGLFNGASYPWSLSLDDLDLISRFVGSPDVFLHYAQRRIELQESQEDVIGDELDLFGTYLDCRLHPSRFWGKEHGEVGGHRMFAFAGCSSRFDDWYQFEQGEKENYAEIKLDVPPVFSELLEELRRLNEDGARWITFALLGLSDEGIFNLVEAIKQLREQALEYGKVGRITFQDGGLVISVLRGEGIPMSQLHKQTASRCALEKYRLWSECSLSIGIGRVNNPSLIESVAWLEGPWGEDQKLEAAINSELPRLIAGQKLPGRNEPCICGSGRKFKKCCLNKIKR